MHGDGNGGTGFTPDTVDLDPTSRDRTRGNCTQDRRHNFNVTTVATVPRFENRALSAIASNWQLATICRYNSVSYLTVRVGRDRALNGTNPSNQVANYDGSGALTGNNGPGVPYLNGGAFSQPQLGTLGNVGIRSVRGPAQWDFDVALSKNFPFGETQSLEFRAEAYNLTNSFRANNPETRIISRRFGIIRSADDSRFLQFAF